MRESGAIRMIRDASLALLFVVLAGAFALAAFAFFFSPTAFVWSLTPLGNLVFDVVLSALYLVASLGLLREPKSPLVGPVLGGSAACVLAFVPRADTLLLLAVGALGIAAGSVVGRWRAMPGDVPVSVVVLAALAVGMAAQFLGWHFLDWSVGGISRNTVLVKAPSPDGRWVLNAIENDPGATGRMAIDVTVVRDVGGLLRQEKTVYVGSGERPTVRWVDSRTVDVNGRTVDIYRDQAIDGYE